MAEPRGEHFQRAEPGSFSERDHRTADAVLTIRVVSGCGGSEPPRPWLGGWVWWWRPRQTMSGFDPHAPGNRTRTWLGRPAVDPATTPLAIRHMAREAEGRTPNTARIDALLDVRSAATVSRTIVFPV